jgi:hypothetical protein
LLIILNRIKKSKLKKIYKRDLFLSAITVYSFIADMPYFYYFRLKKEYKIIEKSLRYTAYISRNRFYNNILIAFFFRKAAFLIAQIKCGKK